MTCGAIWQRNGSIKMMGKSKAAAVGGLFQYKPFVARAPLRKRFAFAAGNDGRAHFRALAAHSARVLRFRSALSNQRAQGMPGARCACRRMCNGGRWQERTHVSQVTPESTGIPRAMVYGLWRARLGGRFFHRRRVIAPPA